MTAHIANRDRVIDFLRSELLGPWYSWDDDGAPPAAGAALATNTPVEFAKKSDSYGPWVVEGSGEEILTRDSPTKRYGIGVLYPLETSGGSEPSELSDDADGSAQEEAPTSGLSDQAVKELETIRARTGLRGDEADALDLTSANEYRPSSMAISLLVDLDSAESVEVELRGGVYRQFKVLIEGTERVWWSREAVVARASLKPEELLRRRGTVTATLDEIVGLPEHFNLRIQAFSRPTADGRSLLTISATNATPPGGPGPLDALCLFQTRFQAWIEASGEPLQAVHPYPGEDNDGGTGSDPEQESFRLLYRHAQTFATGHGCSADWKSSGERASHVRADPLPIVETPSVTPDAKGQDGEPIEVKMAPLAGLVAHDDGIAGLERVLDGYAEWITVKRGELTGLPSEYRDAGERHLVECDTALDRMRDGVLLLRTEPQIFRAFQLANEAILNQQLRSRRARKTLVNGMFWEVEGDPEPPHWSVATDRGSWRAFQIAFLLASLRSAAFGDDKDRSTVELIWFPTGGGKTEAYLGLAAFSMFLRRLRDPTDTGVEVIMRYTLRLLTQQQFQRAGGLICAMELLRRREVDLGDEPFSIGMWLGSGSSPNTRRDATAALRKLGKDPTDNNPFVLLRCPSCSAELGPRKSDRVKSKSKGKSLNVAGYEELDGTVRFRCPDDRCHFSDERALPIFVIDEDIYDRRPSMIVGTVDKFAALAWRPECRSIFGIATDGTRQSSPPGTIIQDELHLIAGPLGSMVGLYEGLIEDLCTDHRSGQSSPPKIIASTATIRRYEDQVTGLYARKDARLFPPRGLDAGDSFFAKTAVYEDGSPKPGRRYIGIHAPGLGSMQTTQVRVLAAMLQAPMDLAGPERDPWWSLLVFFNSLRELGTSLSLLQSDIPDYLRVIQNRLGLGFDEVRSLRRIQELTGRLSNQEVPQSIEDLERTVSDDAVDVCLASNIIEVGIDIGRLSAMAVVGQPKSTSQYIQVTGRVGRNWWDRPGIVLTLLAPGKPRDRSHFEKFRSYHERLYAQVEPTSVTPFSPPVLERALHAVLCGFVRQHGTEGRSPRPIPESELRTAFELLQSRVSVVAVSLKKTLERVFEKRLDEWRRWDRNDWDRRSAGEDIPLLRQAGAYASLREEAVSWPTPNSLRNVDAECEAEVTMAYSQAEEADV